MCDAAVLIGGTWQETVMAALFILVPDALVTCQVGFPCGCNTKTRVT
jgi:hypothetical protein